MSSPVDVAVGERIRQLRKERRITQTDLAEAIGLTFQQIQKYEKARNRISASKLAAIAKILDVEVADLFEEVPPGRTSEQIQDDELAQLVAHVNNMETDVRLHFMGLIGAIANGGS